MSEKRFVCIDVGYGDDWYITDNGKRLSEMEIVALLNEQQATIEDMGDANATLETEILKLRQQLQEYKENWDDMVELATKTSLRNVELDEQIGQLRKELNDCEKFRYQVFKRIGELNDE